MLKLRILTRPEDFARMLDGELGTGNGEQPVTSSPLPVTRYQSLLHPQAVVRFTRLIWPRTGKFRNDWRERWFRAGEKTKWKGVVDKEEMKARADSPIWKMMAVLYPDGTRSMTPPFAINSGMGWMDEKGKRYHALMVEKDEEEEKPKALPWYLAAAR